jgi:hypothetical protein
MLMLGSQLCQINSVTTTWRWSAVIRPARLRSLRGVETLKTCHYLDGMSNVDSAAAFLSSEPRKTLSRPFDLPPSEEIQTYYTHSQQKVWRNSSSAKTMPTSASRLRTSLQINASSTKNERNSRRNNSSIINAEDSATWK